MLPPLRAAEHMIQDVLNKIRVECQDWYGTWTVVHGVSCKSFDSFFTPSIALAILKASRVTTNVGFQ